MASSSAPVHPYRYLTLFLVLLIGVYLLVFLTGDKQARPKLGIDLQGGTRVTLTARTPDGSKPTREALLQAQDIISARVNGLGVSGSEVVIDGDNLVITVPGNDSSEARNLGQTARLYVRPVIHVIPAQGQAPPPGQAPPGQAPPGQPPRRSDAAGSDAAGSDARPASPGDGRPRHRSPRAERTGLPAEPRAACRSGRTGPSACRSAAPPVPRGATATAATRAAGTVDACAATWPGPRAEGSGQEGRPRPAHRGREGATPERRPKHSDPGVAVPGHPLQRRGRAGRQRRSEPAARDLLAGPQPGLSAGQVDHQR